MQNKKINLTTLLERKDLYPNLLEYISSVKLLTNTDEEVSVPLMYLIRHSIEIGLKSSILYLCEKSDLNSMCTEEKLEGHELTRLYNCFNQHWQNICNKYDLKNQSDDLKTIVKETDKFHIELKELINFYDELDKSSTFFRYGNQNLVQINSNYSFIVEEYSGTVKYIDVTKLIKKYENSMLVFKYLEDALSDYFTYLNDMNNELTQEISY